MDATTPRPTALVTGASSGIGLAFARALADRDHDLVLVARDTARLEALATELRTAYGAGAEVLTADLTESAELAAVEDRLADRGRPVELLVNNAGFGTAGRFDELPLKDEDREIRLNVLALVRLCHAALPAMVERGHGAVVNVSSLGGHQPTPGNATYGATKAFVTSFSQALHEEVKRDGVRVTVLCPGFTRTEFQERAGIDSSQVPGFLWMSADAVAEAALRAVDRDRAVCVPGAANRVTGALTSSLPDAVTRRLAGAVIKRVE